MKMKLAIFLCVMVNLVFGQNPSHQVISGTKYSMIPPDGFIASTNFSGFQNSKLGASIMVTELPIAMQLTVESFTADALRQKGMTLIDKQTIDFNKAKATFISLSQQANGTNYLKQMLVFGDDKKTVILNGIYAEASKDIATAMKAALLSTTYNEQQNDDPLEAVKFKIDVSGTPFKLAKLISGSLLFSTDGKIPTVSPTLIVGNSIGTISTTDQKKFCIERLKKLPRGESNTVKEMNAITIDQLPGYEIIEDGKSNDSKDQLIYQVILFTGTGEYFIIVGSATEAFQTNLLQFKNITQTFKRK